jgi:hypothetical protein
MPITFPSCPASVLSGPHVGWAHIYKEKTTCTKKNVQISKFNL